LIDNPRERQSPVARLVSAFIIISTLQSTAGHRLLQLLALTLDLRHPVLNFIFNWYIYQFYYENIFRICVTVNCEFVSCGVRDKIKE
jgi:hypothetical protein